MAVNMVKKSRDEKRCGRCGEKIAKGSPYRWAAKFRGPKQINARPWYVGCRWLIKAECPSGHLDFYTAKDLAEAALRISDTTNGTLDSDGNRSKGFNALLCYGVGHPSVRAGKIAEGTVKSRHEAARRA